MDARITQPLAYDATAICGAIVDVLIRVTDADLHELALTKGLMHLDCAARQERVLERFRDSKKACEIGGASLNVIRVLAELGLRTSFAGVVGRDHFDSIVRARLNDFGIRASLMDCELPTGRCLALITPDGERTMLVALGASINYDEQLVRKDVVASSRVLYCSGFSFDSVGPRRALYAAVDHAKSHGVAVAFDLADPSVVCRHRRAFRDFVLDSCDIVFANEAEVTALCDSAPETAASAIAAHGATAVIKLGRRGAIVAAEGDILEIAAVPTAVVDTTGAGDAFAAGFILGMCRGKTLCDSATAAARMAADVISRVGVGLSEEIIDLFGAWGGE